MSSAAPSPSAAVLSGPVAVCIDRPVLALDRPFTYELDAGLGAGVGSLVQVRFHGRLVRGWVLGPTDDVPPRMLPVRRVLSPVRFFDERRLALARWVAERYVAPLAAVLGAMVPPRVAGEEPTGGGVERSGFSEASGASRRSAASPAELDPADLRALLAGYVSGERLWGAIAGGGGGTFVVRPAPEDEQALAVACVAAALAGGRRAILIVPEAHPLPATAAAVREAFGEQVALFLGGDRRSRYRMWLDIAAGRYRVVVGTRPAVFAPLPELGLLYVSRESHARQREERAPYFHVRDVAVARARIEGAVAVAAALCPSVEAAVLEHVRVEPRTRRWPPVEVVAPGPEGRAPRLVAALRGVRRAFLYEPLPGWGVARVCRACGEPAACAACGGTLRRQEGRVRCVVCGADGRCAACGATDFGIARGGAERVEEWARRIAPVPVARIGPQDEPRPPGPAEVLVGGVEAVKDVGPLRLDLVAILDADLAARRPGLSALERAVTTWFEAAAWARPAGRVIVQTRRAGDPAIQSLVTGRPERFHRAELARRAEAGFPVGHAVFRVVGTGELVEHLRALGPTTLLASGTDEATVCLLALEPGAVGTFGRTVRALAERGVVRRVEAEPHL
jgi:primosomal protein N' (replication factor Y)